MTWHVIVNDLIGGWCVANRDKPLSEWAFQSSNESGKIIAECWSELDAARIAGLLNQAEAKA